MATCKAKTSKGNRCKNSAIEGSEYCHIKSHNEPEDTFTNKQQRFIEEYCIDSNATQAAIRAGYSQKTASEQGYQLLQKTSVSEAIKDRMDRLSMSAEEAIKRLTDWGRGSIESFLSEDGSYLDINTEHARRNLHLIKKIKQSERVLQSEESDKVLDRTFEIELHDAKDAVKEIGKVHGIYAPERIEDVTPQPKRLVLIEKEVSK